MKPQKTPDPYAVDENATKAPVKTAPETAAEPEKAVEAGSAPAPAGGQAALFSSCLVDEVHVISFSRSDVLDAAYIERLGDDIYHHLKPIEEPRVVIDLDNVEYLSSSALGMLIALKRVVEKKDGRICIANVRDQLMQVFKLTKLHKALKIHGSVDKAIKSLQLIRPQIRRFPMHCRARVYAGLILLTLLPIAAAHAGGPDEPVRHAIEAVLDPASNRLAVRDAIELPPDLRRPGAEFSLSPVLTIRESDPPVDRMPAKPGEDVRYALTAAPKDGILRVSYDGSFEFSLGAQKEEYTRGFRETKGIVGPEGVYLAGESAWVPEFGDRMIEFTVDVEAPEGWHVISQGNGTSGDGSGRARWDSAGRLEQVFLVGGPLLVERDSAGAVETLVYLHEHDEALSRKYLDATARYIEMYRQLIGPYPYEKFALVENFWETGYGMPSFTLLGPQIIRFPFILTSSYPHEILHNWWGNSVFVDYMTGNWCEGLTAYLADHLIQEQRGLGAGYRRTALQKYRNYVNEGRDFPLSEFRSRHSAATEAVGYGKSLMAFHMLRCRVGDEAFRTALAGFYRKNRGRRASFDDMRVSFEAVTDEDLAPFFAQWVDRAGAPTLVLEDVLVQNAGGGYAITGTLAQTQSGAPFDLEVPIVVRTGAGTESFVVPVRSRREGFELNVASVPEGISVDSAFDVFRVLDPRETPPSIGQLFGEPSILAVLPASGADEGEVARYRELMHSWQADAHEIEVVLDTEISGLPDGRAVWILGRGNRFAPLVADTAVTKAITAPDATIDLAGESVALGDHCLVVIRRHPRSMEKAIGWLLVDPPASFPGMSRKLPHYGKYSYLAFEGDEPTNIVKGQWPTTESPLVVDLREDRQLPLAPISADPRAPLAEMPPVFSRRALMEHVEWLAAPEREGRGLGSAGLEASAAYLAERFAEIGLAPGGDGGTWFQRFTVAEGPEGGPVEAVNVIGVLPGQRAGWAGQSVVLSAHYDHLGLGWPDVRSGHEGRIHFGADDNASGVSVMIEVARNLAEEGGGSRNLVVIAFSAEEAGRLGSRHYVEHPTYPLDQVRGVINLDTIGRLGDNPVAVHGTGTTDEWQHVFRGCSFVTGVPSRNVPGAADGSDQMSFIEKGVPGVQIFTGAHEDYHRSTDTVDKVDGAGLVKIATFLKEAVVYLLEREEPLTVRIDGAAATAAAPAPGRSGRRVSFGTVPEFEFQGDGVKVASLVPGAPAERGGVLAGDVIVRLGGTEIADLRAFSEFLKTLEPGQTVDVIVERDGAEVELKVVVEKR